MLLHFLRLLEQVHFVVLVAYLIWQTASPGVDPVECMLVLVVSIFANVDFFVGRKSSRTASAEARNEHHEATIDNLFDTMVSVLACLDDLVFEEMPVKSMHSLLGSVIPARVDKFSARCVLPCSIDLCDNWLRQIIRVLDMNPVSRLVELSIMRNAMRQRYATVFTDEVGVWLL